MTLNHQRLHYWSFGERRVPTSLPSLPGPLLLGVVTPDRVLSMVKKNWVK